jgi:TPR repeat protein
MRKYLYLIIVVALGSCADQFALEEVSTEQPNMEPASEFQALMEKAKWGDGQAYRKLADCYRDGKGVKRDFIGMLSMASLADVYRGINRMEDYLDSLPKDSEFKLLIDCVEKFEQKQTDEAQTLLEGLVANGSPDGYAIKGISVLEHGDSLGAKRLFEFAAEKGSSLAELLLCIPDWRGAMKPSIEKLASLTDKIPWVNNVLAETYEGKRGYDMKDDKMAAYYYLKADKQACLTKNGAKWLIDYIRNDGDIHLSPSDVKRLQILAGVDLKVAVDTIAVQ